MCQPPKIVRLVAVRWQQRVGIFHGDRLVLCTTKRHYRASGALELLVARPEYSGTELKIHTPHLAAQFKYREPIASCGDVQNSGAAFGRKPRYADKVRGYFGDSTLEPVLCPSLDI
jgi:hypothetical protein